jgi:flagellar basal-body rod protein FlgF
MHVLRGIYESASALLGLQQQEGLLADNLANEETPGYLGESASFGAILNGRLLPPGGRSPGTFSMAVGTLGDYVSSTAGAVEVTGRPLDVAFAPNVFLAVQTPTGIAYTRDGALTVNAAGVLTTATGLPVLARGGGLVRVGGEADTAVTATGEVESQGRPVAALDLVTMPQNRVLPGASPDTYLPLKGTAPVAGGTVTPGALTTSNVNAATALSGIVQVEGQYQADEEAAHTIAQAFSTFLSTGVQP